jgi:hypothetical protein
LELLVAEDYIKEIVTSLLLDRPWHTYKVNPLLTYLLLVKEFLVALQDLLRNIVVFILLFRSSGV